ncbi:hypothetical protein VL20_2944 [Microcystis panniformis FACHB-1757]|uniref:Uncharacterized protein n=1 Tax=Microcystis panniformis FACHB-1757 TaxID=1638788 RepID=A0A0K1S1P7_9CHRO|nr:hypothetical protein VL20_2944 [Microcystis panniformis FACHB-1757]
MQQCLTSSVTKVYFTARRCFFIDVLYCVTPVEKKSAKPLSQTGKRG